jgi:3-oxoadipate enol-lactonase
MAIRPASVLLEARGDGPPVLFLHGTPTPWDVLRPIADACTGHRTLLAALPGYGDAPPWSSESGAVTAVGIAEAIERAVVGVGASTLRVVGFSGGAYHAIHLAARGVLMVESLVLLGGIADITPDVSAAFKGFSAALRAGQSLAGVATARFLSPAFAASHPDACARVEGWLDATSRDNLALELDAVAAGPSLLETLRTFAGTVRARTGEFDLASPTANAAAIARVAPHGSLQVVPGCGHALLEEDRAGTIAAVVAALR